MTKSNRSMGIHIHLLTDSFVEDFTASLRQMKPSDNELFKATHIPEVADIPQATLNEFDLELMFLLTAAIEHARFQLESYF